MTLVQATNAPTLAQLANLGPQNPSATERDVNVAKDTSQKNMRALSPENTFLKNAMEVVAKQDYIKKAYTLADAERRNNGTVKLRAGTLNLNSDEKNMAIKTAKVRLLCAAGDLSIDKVETDKNHPLSRLFEQFLLEAKETIVLKKSGEFIGGLTQESEKVPSKISEELTIGVDFQTKYDDSLKQKTSTLESYFEGFYKPNEPINCDHGEQPAVDKKNKILDIMQDLAKSESGRDILSKQLKTTIKNIHNTKPTLFSGIVPNTEIDLKNVKMNTGLSVEVNGEKKLNINHLTLHHAIETKKNAPNGKLTLLETFLDEMSDKYGLKDVGFAFMANLNEKGVLHINEDLTINVKDTIIQYLQCKEDKANSMGPVHFFACDISEEYTATNNMVAFMKAASEGASSLEAFHNKQDTIRNGTTRFWNEVILPAFEAEDFPLERSHSDVGHHNVDGEYSQDGTHGPDSSLPATHKHQVAQHKDPQEGAMETLNTYYQNLTDKEKLYKGFTLEDMNFSSNYLTGLSASVKENNWKTDNHRDWTLGTTHPVTPPREQ
jgi:hypothetical protein